MGKKRKQYTIGASYGREGVILLEELEFQNNGYTKGRFKCTCGKEFIARITAITANKTIGCGCREGKGLLTHGLSKTPMYELYCRTVAKCYNPEHVKYKWYGARGIIMSEEFLGNPVTFIDYITSLPNYDKRVELKLELDRIDNDKNYERGNLRWATRLVQIYNRRKYGTRAPLEVVDSTTK